jgi:subtilisin family serine protease
MKTAFRRGVLLALFTTGWLGFSAWVLLAAPVGPASRARTALLSHLAAQDGSGEPSYTEEPPPPRTLWDRLSEGASALLRRHDPDAQAEAMQRLGVPAWHAARLRGRGVKVAILDSGFRGYRQALGKVLPARVKVKSFRRDGNLEARDSQHGILCGEVIHRLAPEAELLFVNWEPEQPAGFLEAVRWARREGAQIISCALIMPTWSDGEGGGSMHRALRAALGQGDRAGDGLMFASAGNTALRHWAGPYRPGKAGWHQWANAKLDNAIRPYAGDVSVELNGSGSASYELVVRDTTAKREVGRSRSLTAGGCFAAAVRFVSAPGHRYAARLRQLSKGRVREAQSGRLHLTVLGARLTYSNRAGSIPFPGDGAEVVAVAAVDARGRRHAYSSCGPNGSHPKPDLSAIVPFPSAFRPSQPFSGTSAAAPQAAGLAALLWSRNPSWSAQQVRAALEKAARSPGAGHDTEAGHGVVKLPLP